MLRESPALPRLSGGGLVVFLARGFGRQVEPVDAKRLDAELSTNEMHDPTGTGSLNFVDVHN
jgi:hypothetical protein